MNLAELREEFKSSSGFLFWSNNEIDKALNNAIKFLDSKTYTDKKDQRYFCKIPSGSFAISFPFVCKVIKEVFIVEEEEGRLKLPKLEVYPEITEDPAKPTGYMVINTDTYDKTVDKMIAIGKFADITFTNGTLRGLLFNTISDRDYYLDILGRFETLPLNDVNTENWWSVNYPELLITTSLYVLDINKRNTSGGTELYNTILDTIREINNDWIEEEIEDLPSVLGG